MDSRVVRQKVVAVCHRLYELGLVAGVDGNVSVRLGSDRLLITPTGLPKENVQEDDLVEIDLAGGQLLGERLPSSEAAMHLELYRARVGVNAVVHAHPPVATGFAVAGEGLPADVLPEAMVQLGPVPLVPFAMPGTPALAESLGPWVADHDAFLLANHGAVTVGATLQEASRRMEVMEHVARILLTARLLGRVNPLGSSQVAELTAVRKRTRQEVLRDGDDTGSRVISIPDHPTDG